MKKVFITGILGVDASILAEKLLLDGNCEVYGLMRRSSNPNYSNIQHIKHNKQLHLVCGDINDRGSLMDLVGNIQPTHYMNFAGFTMVTPSWESPSSTVETNFGGVLNGLEAIRKIHHACRFFQAGSSEIFGDCKTFPQDETTPHNPRNFYGISKSAAAHAVRIYREKYGLFCINGFLWNHECSKRNIQFVFPKVCKEIARIAYLMKHKLKFFPLQLGNLDAGRDYSYAPDIVDGIWKAVNHSKPIDFVFASGNWHTISEIVEAAFIFAKIEYRRVINGLVRYETPEGQPLVEINKDFMRDEAGVKLIGNATLAKRELNWAPKVSFLEMVKNIVDDESEKLNNP